MQVLGWLHWKTLSISILRLCKLQLSVAFIALVALAALLVGGAFLGKSSSSKIASRRKYADRKLQEKTESKTREIFV